MFQNFCRHVGLRPDEFRGVTMTMLPQLEEFFQINIVIYALEKHGNEVYCQLIWRGRTDKLTTMRLNLCDNHFSYIRDFDLYSKSFKCGKCKRIFSRSARLKTHESKCITETKHVYPCGGFGNDATVFEQLEEYGFIVPEDHRYYRFRSFFDYETLCCRVPAGDQKLKLTKKLIPASVSIATNVPGTSSDGWEFTKTRCFVSSGSPDDLIVSMYSYLSEISDMCFSFYERQFKQLLEDIDFTIEHLKQREVTATFTGQPYSSKDLMKARSQLVKWMRQHVVLGFNSARFDVPLILTYLVPYLLRNDMLITNTIKSGNGLFSFGTDKMIFLDILKYLGPGINYVSFLKAFNIKDEKLVFCYDAFDSLEMLDLRSIPSHDAFFSELTQSNISVEQYQKAVERWNSQGMSTFRDFLVDYNNADTGPGLQAASAMWDHWKSLGIDMFKQGVSLPGLSSIYLFKTLSPKHVFLNVKEDHAWLLDDMKSNLIGGPSILYSRHAEVGETSIPGTNNAVKSIRTYDANSLYLHCLMGEMPTGNYAIYEPILTDMDRLIGSMAETTELTQDVYEMNMKTVFKRRYAYPFASREIAWLSYMSHVVGVKVNSKHNGRQKVIRYKGSAYYPDGYIQGMGVLLGYNSCYRLEIECNYV